jgi:Domain of unknown function (DUF4365)
MLPKAPSTEERLGVMAVATSMVKTGLIWRETPNSDVGIDGHAELVDESGFATGKTVAIQLKSGNYYFRSTSADDRYWKFKPDKKHIPYWGHYPLPVLLILHLPSGDISYWVDARHQIRSSKVSNIAEILIPKENVLQGATKLQLLESAGALSDEQFRADLRDVLKHMLLTHTGNASFPVTYFDLFVHGITNIGRSLYFGMDLADNAAQFNFDTNGSEYGCGIGGAEHDFLFGYTRLLMSQRLAEVDFSDYLIDWKERHLQPRFLAPLTRRGRSLIQLIHEDEDKLIINGHLEKEGYLRVAQERQIRIGGHSYYERMPRIRKFQELSRKYIHF